MVGYPVVLPVDVGAGERRVLFWCQRVVCFLSVGGVLVLS
jgi:hypothetical protein